MPFDVDVMFEGEGLPEDNKRNSPGKTRNAQLRRPEDNRPEDNRPEDNIIDDDHFLSQLRKLQRLRNFIISQSIKDDSKAAASITLGSLNSLRPGENGRQPSDAEWDEMNGRLQYFYGLLSETQRRKFNFTLAAPMLKTLPTVLVGTSIVFLVLSTIVPTQFTSVVFTAFLLWTVTVGALGSIAFILVNALGIQVDPSVDVTDRDSTFFRVLLGALFSIILMLPFGYPVFEQIKQQIIAGKSFDPKPAALLLMPFLFGFSTSLVLTVLNRLIDGVQTFFGVSAKKP